MFNLDPGKLLVIAVVAIILLGPDRLPQVARQVGGAWRSFNEFRHRMESEVRSSMPDLPSDLGDRPAGPLALCAAQPPVHHVTGRRRVDDGDDGVPDGSVQPPLSTNGAGTADETGADGAMPVAGRTRMRWPRPIPTPVRTVRRAAPGRGTRRRRAGRRGSRRRCPASATPAPPTGRAEARAACARRLGAGGHRARRPDAQLIGTTVVTLPFTAKRKRSRRPTA